MLKILTVPEQTEILRRKSEPVEKINDELAEFLRELGETLKRQKDPAGVGLSAVQVGRPIRAFAIYLSDTRKPELVFYINPEIISHPNEMTLGEDLVENHQQQTTNNQRPFLEGCLSIPNIYGPVLRWTRIEAKSLILTESQILPSAKFKAQSSKFSLDGLAARVFQHELDHLNGILFTDHVLQQGNHLYQDFGDGPEQIDL